MAGPLIIDTKLLVLLVVGVTNETYISKHRRIRKEYDTRDFRWVADLVASSSGLLFVPNVVTEASNFLRQIEDPIGKEVMLVFGHMLKRAEERYIPSREAVERQEYARLGVTDAVLLTLATATDANLLTVDLPLFLAAQAAGLMATNYNHVREARGWADR